MNLKNIALIVLLLPIASYSNSTESRIKELREAQFQKELEISNLTEVLIKRHKSLARYKSNTSDFLELLRESNEQLKIDASLDQLIEDFKEEFDNAIDIKQLFSKSFLESDSEVSYESLRIWTLVVTVERRLIDKLTVKCETCVKELIKINKELKNSEK
ncbi:MAG: hypothetical protein P4L31_01110 [Candidatus Babeliales bacterium]|nr:hypothetical protein [Candidatus Babeliales bacterium]